MKYAELIVINNNVTISAKNDTFATINTIVYTSSDGTSESWTCSHTYD
jgi:hypothetical protein